MEFFGKATNFPFMATRRIWYTLSILLVVASLVLFFTRGLNLTIDFTGGNRPGPILQFINNVFDGASDDCLDLDSTDAWIEGNIFMHVHRDPNRTDNALDTASAISGGVLPPRFRPTGPRSAATSAGLRPAAGSSIISKRGAVASARAISRSRCSP